jgi:hypothetical protein
MGALPLILSIFMLIVFAVAQEQPSGKPVASSDTHKAFDLLKTTLLAPTCRSGRFRLR